MKLTSGVFIESAQLCDETGRFEIWLCINVNRENTSQFFSFDPDLTGPEFKNFCRILRLSQKRTRDLFKDFTN